MPKPAPYRPSPMVERMFADAVRFHQCGDLIRATDLYRRVLAATPSHPHAHYNVGIALKALGRPDEAIAAYQRAVAVTPGSADAYSNLGAALQEQGRFDEAITACRSALAIRPDLAEAHFNLGLALQAQGKTGEAIAAYGQAIAIKGDLAEVHASLGAALRQRGALDEAIAAYGQAIAITPGRAELYSDLGNALQERGMPHEAIAAYGQAIALKPELAEAYSNLGFALNAQGRLEEATLAYRQAVALKPGYAVALSNLGGSLREQGRLDEAITCCRQAIGISPDLAAAHNNLGLALLHCGQFAEGYREWEWRFQAEKPARPFPQPWWTGEDLSGRRILVWGEQGIGDELVSAGLCGELLTLGASVILECRPRLVPLLKRSWPAVEVVAAADPPDPRCLAKDVDFQLPMGSLPALLRSKPDDFRPIAPYLKADSALTAELRRRYQGEAKPLLVGISWWSRHPTLGLRFSSTLSAWRKVLEVPGIRFISLQYGNHHDEIAKAEVPLILDESIDPLLDMDRFSSQVAAMDLVITIDNSTVSMATGLGKPVWNVVAAVADWRWMLDRQDSPWHPTLRLFRQPGPDDWHGALEQVRAELSMMAAR